MQCLSCRKAWPPVLSLDLFQSTMEFWHLAVFRGQSDDTSNHEHTMSCPFLRGLTRRHFFCPQIDQFFFLNNIKLHLNFFISFFYHPILGRAVRKLHKPPPFFMCPLDGFFMYLTCSNFNSSWINSYKIFFVSLSVFKKLLRPFPSPFFFTFWRTNYACSLML